MNSDDIERQTLPRGVLRIGGEGKSSGIRRADSGLKRGALHVAQGGNTAAPHHLLLDGADSAVASLHVAQSGSLRICSSMVTFPIIDCREFDLPRSNGHASPDSGFSHVA